MKSIYLMGSLRNPKIPEIGNQLRDSRFDVFDDWFSAGPIADDSWRYYEKERGHTYQQALEGLAAQHVFNFDLWHLTRCDLGVLVLPAGKSSHLELGWIIGQNKPGYVLMDNPERWDVMYQFATKVAFTTPELVEMLQGELP
ncbi:MAG: hypothetical protein V3V96_15600 [Acidiferrobacterales bacterium]